MSSVVKAVTGAVSGVVKAVGSVVTGVVNAVSSVVSSVVNFVVTPFLGLFGLGSPNIPDANTDAVKGVLVQHTGSDVRVPVVYGYRKVAGTVVYCETGSTENKYLWVAYVFAEGQVEGIRELWIDNVQIPSTNIAKLNNGERVTVSGTDSNGAAGKFNNLTQLQFYKGIFVNDPKDTNVGVTVKAGIFSGAPSFTTDMNYNGLVTVFARYEWPSDTTNNPFGGSIPKLEICLLGRKVADLTTGNPENYLWGDFSNGYTERYSTNPAEIVLDYLRNPYYGKGLTNDEINWDSFKTAAAKCNQEVEHIKGVFGPIMRLDYVVNTGTSIFGNAKDMLANFRAYLPYTQGKYKLLIEDAGNPNDILSGSAPIAATFTKDDIVGEINYTGIDRSSKYNQVVVNYCDPDKQWSPQSVVYPETQEERNFYIAQDGGREYKNEVTFTGITNPATAKDMARLIFNKSRWQDSISLTVSSEGFELEPGDNIYIDSNILKFGTDPFLGAVPWRIVSIKLNNNYTFALGCVRNPDFIYPHVRTNEVDYKYALFVPKGSTRYYPPEPFGTPIGYKPPTSAPTDPNSPLGPPPSPGPVPLTDYVRLFDLRTEYRNGVGYVLGSFLQPPVSGYDSVTLTWRENIVGSTPNVMNITTKPGSNQPITFEFSPVFDKKSYVVTTQVKYASGEYSTAVITETVAVELAIPTPPTPVPTPAPVTPPSTTAPTPPANPANNYFDSTLTGGRAILDGSGHPLNPRAINFTLYQDKKNGTNAYIDKVIYYWKPSGETQWFKGVQSIVGVPQFSKIEFGIPVGNSLYSVGLVPGSGGVPATVDDYDFIFRFGYSDGKTSTWQWRSMNQSVEYGPFGYDTVVATGSSPFTFTKELSADYQPVEAPAGSTGSDYRNIAESMTTYQLYATQESGINKVYFWASAPDALAYPALAGWRILYRKFVSGATLAESPETVIDISPYKTSTSILTTGDTAYHTGVGCVIPNIEWDVEYDFIAVPLVWYNGAKTPANKCWKWRSRIHNRTTETKGSNPYPYVNGQEGNWFSRYTPTQMSYLTAKASLDAPYPLTDPTVLLKSIAVSPEKTLDKLYHTITYQLPTNARTGTGVGVDIYRRAVLSRKTQALSSNVYYNAKTLYGAGQWEKMSIQNSNNTPDSNYVVKVNLRPAISEAEFANYFDPTKPKQTNPLATGNFLYSNGTNTAPVRKRLTQQLTQILIVVRYIPPGGTTAVQSAKGLLVDLYTESTLGLNGVYLDNINLLNDQIVVNVEDMNLIESNPAPITENVNMLRRLNEFRVNVDASVIVKPGYTESNFSAYVKPTTTPPIL